MERVCLLIVLQFVLCCNARPASFKSDGPVVSFGARGADHYIIGGSDATLGAWPWQLSMQAQVSTNWAHFCGASLLSSTKVLTAAHCVDGLNGYTLRVVAGALRLSQTSGVQTSIVSRYIMHERYELDESLGSSSNDIAIVYLSSPISRNANVQFLTLPPNDSDDFTGKLCTITGWGRTSSSSSSPDVLKQADIGVITTSECSSRVRPVPGALAWDKHICLFDSNQQRGSCSGDSGGPLNCPDGFGGHYVAGVCSWGVSSNDVCLQAFPSVYTRTSSYLYWIYSH